MRMLSSTLKKSKPAPKKVGYQQSSKTASRTNNIPPLYLSISHPRARYPKANPAAHPTTKKDTVHKSDINHAGGTISSTPNDIRTTCGAPTKKRTSIPPIISPPPISIIQSGLVCSISIFSHAPTVIRPYFFLYKKQHLPKDAVFCVHLSLQPMKESCVLCAAPPLMRLW